MKNSTKEIVTVYYDGIRQKNGWENVIADDISFTGGGQSLKGKAAYIEATNRFLRLVKTSTIKNLIIEGDKAGVVVDYELQSPKGNTANCEVAEILSVKDNKINSSDIFFDTAAFRAFVTQG